MVLRTLSSTGQQWRPLGVNWSNRDPNRLADLPGLRFALLAALTSLLTSHQSSWQPFTGGGVSTPRRDAEVQPRVVANSSKTGTMRQWLERQRRESENNDFLGESPLIRLVPVRSTAKEVCAWIGSVPGLRWPGTLQQEAICQYCCMANVWAVPCVAQAVRKLTNLARLRPRACCVRQKPPV